ncbi:hypothetical protein MKW94_009628 [Papaver nudicaule]|uniref:Dirigent protein n=1 Tax=Papaver nudicaule TaxID=74823 RepID=A0AA41UY47_PAPNU|nr:hypothetical protein [Papaver nudicaule]
MSVTTRGALLQLSFVVLLLVLLIMQAQAKQDWFSETVPYKPADEKVTKLHFYFQDVNDLLVAKHPTADKFSTLFTNLYIVDNPLTEGPELNSTLVGRVQGLIGFAAQKETASLMGLGYVFTSGKFNGSTLVIVTRNPILIPDREFPIVGGTGLFKLARGFANVKTNWHETIPSKAAEVFGKEKVTKLHFYFHDTISGKNPTGVVVAKAPTTTQSKTAFGLLTIIDDPLTEGPKITSKLIGRAQGLVGFASQEELASLMALSYVFTDGKLNGSTISIVTRNPIMNPVREFAVVGGTGLFRFARGFADVKTYWVNSLGDAIVEYNMRVVAARFLLLPVLCIVAVVIAVSVTHQIRAQKADWFETVPYEEAFRKEMTKKVTRLHFYFHDMVSGKNPTAIPIAQAPTPIQSSTMFGTLRMVDDPLTEGLDASSKVVGRAQGMYGFAGQDQLSLIAAISYVFTDEKLKKGSSLSILSNNPILNSVRELAIVGGTGSFRFATGFAQIKTSFFNLTTGDAIVEYNVTVIHY